MKASISDLHLEGLDDGIGTKLGDPSHDIITGFTTVLIFFVLFAGWAAFTRLDAAAYATGNLAVAQQRQSVQHRDGGVLEAIYVREGQYVSRGQVLARLSAAEIYAQERVMASQSIRLLAQRARLVAEQLGQVSVKPPGEFLSFSGRDRVEAEAAMRLQQSELQARAAVLAAKTDALRQRVIQSHELGRGYIKRASATREQLRIIDDQIHSLQPVAERGFVSKTRIRELERLRAELRGESGQYSASDAQARGAAREAQVQVLETERSFAQDIAADLRDVEISLGEVLPKWNAAQDQLARTKIRSPTTGLVVGLTAFTPGGVIAPGEKIMEIVPESSPLIVQVKLSPEDVDDLQVGQKAIVKFSGLHERRIPTINGRLTRLSADAFTDAQSQRSYYTGDIIVPPEEVQLIRKVRGSKFRLRAGMPAQVLIPLQKRSALEYALEPLLSSLWASFREH